MSTVNADLLNVSQSQPSNSIISTIGKGLATAVDTLLRPFVAPAQPGPKTSLANQNISAALPGNAPAVNEIAINALRIQPSAGPSLIVSVEPKPAAGFRDFVCTLSNGQRVKVTLFVNGNSEDLREKVQALINQMNVDMLKETCFLFPAPNAGEIVVVSSSQTQTSIKDQNFAQLITNRTFMPFNPKEYVEYEKSAQEKLTKPTPKPAAKTPEKETPKPAVITAPPKTTIKARIQSVETTAPISNEPVTIKSEDNSCYLVAFLHAHILGNTKIDRLISDINKHGGDLADQIKKTERTLTDRERELEKTTLEHIKAEPPNSATLLAHATLLKEQIGQLNTHLEELRKRQNIFPKILDFLEQIKKKNPIDDKDMNDLFRLLVAIKNEHFINDLYNPEAPPPNDYFTRCGQMGDFNEVYSTFMGFIYPTTSPSPYLLKTESYLQIKPKDPVRTKTDLGNTLPLQIPNGHGLQQQLDFQTMWQTYIEGNKAMQPKPSKICLDPGSQYVVVDLPRRQPNGAKFTGEITEIPLLDGTAAIPFVLKNSHIESIVCHSSDGVAAHIFTLIQENGQWAIKDNSRNSLISLKEAQDLAHQYVIQITYVKN